MDTDMRLHPAQQDSVHLLIKLKHCFEQNSLYGLKIKKQIVIFYSKISATWGYLDERVSRIGSVAIVKHVLLTAITPDSWDTVHGWQICERN